MVSIVLALALALGGPTQAGGPPALTMDAAVALALKQHPELARLTHLLAASRARNEADAAEARPQAFVGVIAQTSTPGTGFTLKTPDIAGSAPSSMVLGHGVEVPGYLDSGTTVTIGQVLWNPALAARTAADAVEDDALVVRRRLALARVVRDVKLAYVEVLRAQRRETIASQVVRMRELTLKQATAMAKAGLIASLDADQASVRVQGARADALQAAEDTKLAFASLAVHLGQDELEPGACRLEAPPLDATEAPAKAATAPSLELAKAEAMLAASRVAVARASTAPRLAAFANAGLSPTGGDKLAATAAYAGGISLNAPVFTSGLAEAREREARAAADAAREALRAEGQRVRQELLTARLGLSKDLAQRQVLAEQRRIAARTLELARRRYQFRLASFVDVVTAETAAADVEARFADAEARILGDRANLAFADGSDVRRYEPGDGAD